MTNKVEKLQKVLATSYTLYLKTQNYHWNVTGPHFYSLHKLFEEHYNDLFTAVDEIAERIRVLGAKSYGTFKKYLEISEVKEGNENLSYEEMVADLAKDQDIIVKLLKETSKDFEDDDATLDLINARIDVHEKNKWMLKSTLEN